MVGYGLIPVLCYMASGAANGLNFGDLYLDHTDLLKLSDIVRQALSNLGGGKLWGLLAGGCHSFWHSGTRL